MVRSWCSPFLQAGNPYCLGSPNQPPALGKGMLLLTQHILQPSVHVLGGLAGWLAPSESQMETSSVLFPPCCGKGNRGFCHPSLPMLLLLAPRALCPMRHPEQTTLSRGIRKAARLGLSCSTRHEKSSFSLGRHLKANFPLLSRQNVPAGTRDCFLFCILERSSLAGIAFYPLQPSPAQSKLERLRCWLHQ